MRLTGMTRYIVWFGLFRGRAAEVCSAEATELPVGERPPVSVANGLCHPLVMTRYIVGSLTTLSTMVFSNLYPADPVDPVIRVLLSISPFHDLFVAPIYMEGGLICKTWLACGLPAVILNLVRDDLRMMASKPVAAKAGGMKHYAECIGLYMCLSRNWCRLFLDWVLVSDVGFTQINADN